MKRRGRVFLIGAGPGDPELLTVKATRALRACDVLLVDDLVSRDCLAWARGDARVIDVGKRGRCRSTSQRFIEKTMIDLVRSGHVVGRVKGGDPFVFGRGAEEVAALARARVPTTVIPGITAGLAVPASAGIAVTARGVARGVALVTGHACDDGEVDWRALARSGLTIVVYMGVGRAAAIAAALLDGGLPPSTPAAAIESGTLATQRTVPTTLGHLGRALVSERVTTPAVLVIGDVAAGAHAVATRAA